jgi:uncharacterized protein YndB with AHSA1/START domain
MITHETVFSKDLQNKKLTVVRSFDAPLELVWKTWTKSELLDQWWAPKPYKAETKKMDFREGGFWQYAMIGPEGHTAWCKVDFKKIVPLKNINTRVGFCDEEGKDNPAFPVMYWNKQFSEGNDGTDIRIEITFDTDSDMEAIIKMGFQEGFTAGLVNLDELLSK